MSSFMIQHHVEHFHQCLIARIGKAAPKHLFLAHTYISGVFQSQCVCFFFDHNTKFSKEICIDQTVRKGLADCLMHRRIIDTVAAPCFKGNFDVFLQFVINAEIKITEISGPFAGAGLKPVLSSGWMGPASPCNPGNTPGTDGLKASYQWLNVCKLFHVFFCCQKYC